MLMPVEDAQKIILQQIRPLGRLVSKPLQEAADHLLGEDARADGDIPPFTNTAMDGFAVRTEDVASASPENPVTLRIVGVIRAGHPGSMPIKPGECYKIMTGAPVPDSADAVVPVEWTQPGTLQDRVDILRAVNPGASLRWRGEDMQVGQVVVARGTTITAPVLGMLATIGYAEVPVAAPPKVAILSTGDELREPGVPLTPGTIRNSNTYALYAAIQQAGGEPVIYPSAPDDPDAIRKLFTQAASECDLLVSSGGVSVGDFDFVKPVIESLGHLTLWRVNLKPGKPLAFGDVLGKPIIGLPGNPVSALVTFELFVRPVIRTLLGDTRWERPVLSLPLFTAFNAVEDRRQYVRCRLMVQEGQLMLWPHDNQGSAVQTSWQDVDALMIVPENTGPYRAGDWLEALVMGVDHIWRP
ncbi:MAG: molybdopterin molybdotransferase MoeA [Firmicutes bacterium]|nr:molybdopterin molybdotransferase MoeA [Bacillota bacterium]